MDDEARKAYQKAYRQRPEVKLRRKIKSILGKDAGING